MAAPSTFTPTKEGQAKPESSTVHRPTPSSSDVESSKQTERKDRKGLLTAGAIVLSLALGVTTVLLGNNLLPQGLTTANLAVFMLISVVVAFVGTIPMRWGWYVVPGVTTAFFGLGMYNLAASGDTVFAYVPGEALGYAVVGPASGVLLGYVLQLVYSFVAGD